MAQNQILDANLSRYADGSEIEDYLQQGHHKARAELSLSWLKKILEGMKLERQPKGIELAAGSGVLSDKIRNMGADVIACDAAEKALELAYKKGLRTKKFDASGVFPFEDNSFDFVFAGELVEHLFDTRSFINECRRVLAPKGVLMLTTPNLATLTDRVRFLFGGTPRQINPFHEYLYLHIRPFTANLLRETLENANFCNIEIRSQSIEIKTPWRDYSSEFLARAFPALGRSLISIGFKPT